MTAVKFKEYSLWCVYGIESFEEIRKLGFYYIDKTRLIEQLLQGWGKVTLLPALAVLVRLSI